MLVFAWILWVIFILGFLVDVALLIGATCALNNPYKDDVRVNIRLIPLLIHIACFIFLCFYLFG